MHRWIIRGIAALSICLLAVSAILPWFRVPIDIQVTSDGIVECVSGSPWSARPYSLVCLVAALSFAWRWTTGKLRRDRPPTGLAILVAALFFFPYFVSIWDPSLAASSARLFEQHENLVAFSGDSSVDQEYGPLWWRNYLYANSEVLLPVPVFRPLIWGPGTIQFGQLKTLFEAIGYTDQFCQFVGPGWFVAIAGALGLLLEACTVEGGLQQHHVILALKAALLAIGAGIVAALVPVIIVAVELGEAREATALGDYVRAISHMQRAALVLPVLGENADYVLQMGVLHWRLGRHDSPQAKIYRAMLLEHDGIDAQALETYRQVLWSTERGTAVHHEACCGLTRSAIISLNSGLANRATELLETVLAHEPCNLKVNFVLQLAYLQDCRHVELELLVKRVESIYARYQYPMKYIIMSFSEENAQFAAFRQGHLEDAIVHGFRAKHPEAASPAYKVKHQ